MLRLILLQYKYIINLCVCVCGSEAADGRIELKIHLRANDRKDTAKIKQHRRKKDVPAGKNKMRQNLKVRS